MNFTGDTNSRESGYVEPAIITDIPLCTDVLRPFNNASFDDALKSAQVVPQKKIINKLNHLNFTSGYVLARITHSSRQEDFLVRLKPGACSGNLVTLICPAQNQINLEEFTVQELLIDKGKTIIIVPVEIVTRDKISCTAMIPDKGFALGRRKVMRVSCRDIDAEIFCKNIKIYGELEDFSIEGLRIKITDNSLDLNDIIDNKSPLSVQLKRERTVVCSVNCQVIYSVNDKDHTSIILKPMNLPQARFSRRKNRHPRLKLVPTPKITFLHPLINKYVAYEISDIGTTGFSVDETSDEAFLMPGMRILDVTILFSGSFQLSCSAQVVYSERKRGKPIHHGFSILDMDTSSYFRLFDIVSNANDPDCNMTSVFNMDALWEFFFQSGFIYPKKYEFVSRYKEEFQRTYTKLYQECQEIFSSITYQKNGRIYGHNCALKVYQRSWMIYHLAATSKGARRIGLDIMRQSHNFYDGMYRLPSMGMDFMVIYYRPNNKFPDYFFGGFCRHFKNPKACSMDSFIYLMHTLPSEQSTLPDQWSLQPGVAEDYETLRAFYENTSGGLMLDMFGFDKEYPEESLENIYDRLGLIRKCYAYTLKYKEDIAAVLIVDQSNTGTNLSELLNTIKIIVINQERMPWSVLQKAINLVGHVYEKETIPIMIYPYEYGETAGIEDDKQYNLWIINSKYGDEYVEYIKGLLKFSTLKFARFMIREIAKKL